MWNMIEPLNSWNNTVQAGAFNKSYAIDLSLSLKTYYHFFMVIVQSISQWRKMKWKLYFQNKTVARIAYKCAIE